MIRIVHGVNCTIRAINRSNPRDGLSFRTFFIEDVSASLWNAIMPTWQNNRAELFQFTLPDGALMQCAGYVTAARRSTAGMVATVCLSGKISFTAKKEDPMIELQVGSDIISIHNDGVQLRLLLRQTSPARLKLHVAYRLKTSRQFRISGPSTYDVTGLVTSFRAFADGDFEVAVQLQGPLIPVKEEEALQVRNVYYVGHPKVTCPLEQGSLNPPATSAQPARWTRATLADAIKHAELQLAANPDQDHCVVVKIVKVVRRPQPKFIVEDV